MTLPQTDPNRQKLNSSEQSLVVNGKRVPFVKYARYQEIILWWALDNSPGRIPRPIPLRTDSYWAQWAVTFKNAKMIYDGSSPNDRPEWPAIYKTEGILSPMQDILFAEKTIINIAKTGNA